MNQLCDLSAVELRRLIGTKEVSPVEVLKAFRERIESVNPGINAITATCWPRAEHEAKLAEQAVLRGEALGLLHGMPIGIKDLDDTEAVVTTYGSTLYRDHVPTADEYNVARVRQAGAIVVGKTNVPQFGLGGHSTNPVYGPTRNPYNRELIAGGSSGGSAAAVAARLLPFCTGSDSGGSSRNPAAYCGVVGLRQSAGIVPQPKRKLTWSPFPIKGPIARDISDSCLLLAAMAGHDSSDPFSHPLNASDWLFPQRVDLSQVKAAFSSDLGFALVDDIIRSRFTHCRQEFQAVFASVGSAHPDNPHGNDMYEMLRSITAVVALKPYMAEHRDLLGENNVAMYEKGRALTGEQIAWITNEQTALYQRFDAFFKDHDLLITPTVGVPPHHVDELYAKQVNGQPTRTFMHTLALTYGITVVGHPAISIPCGIEPVSGTPFHLQLVAGKGQDAFLLGAAHALMSYFSTRDALRAPRPDEAALLRWGKGQY